MQQARLSFSLRVCMCVCVCVQPETREARKKAPFCLRCRGAPLQFSTKLCAHHALTYRTYSKGRDKIEAPQFVSAAAQEARICALRSATRNQTNLRALHLARSQMLISGPNCGSSASHYALRVVQVAPAPNLSLARSQGSAKEGERENCTFVGKSFVLFCYAIARFRFRFINFCSPVCPIFANSPRLMNLNGPRPRAKEGSSKQHFYINKGPQRNQL